MLVRLRDRVEPVSLLVIVTILVVGIFAPMARPGPRPQAPDGAMATGARRVRRGALRRRRDDALIGVPAVARPVARSRDRCWLA
jgi:hypothetical protein